MSVPVAWIVGLMATLEPSAPWRGTFEKSAEAIARISEAEPVFDDAAKPENNEERTAALLVAIAWYESRLKPDAKSKNGQWYCLFQVDRRHFSEPDRALRDPDICTRAAVKIVRSSLTKCKSRPANERLAMFTSGACDRGVAESRYRMYLAGKLLKEHPVEPANPTPH